MKWNDFQCKVFSIFCIYSVVAIIAIESYVLSCECIKCLRLQFGRTSTECLNGIWMEWWWSPVGIVRDRWELCRGMRNHFSDREIKKNINNANKYEEEDLAHNQKWETSNCVHITKCDRRYFFLSSSCLFARPHPSTFCLCIASRLRRHYRFFCSLFYLWFIPHDRIRYGRTFYKWKISIGSRRSSDWNSNQQFICFAIQWHHFFLSIFFFISSTSTAIEVWGEICNFQLFANSFLLQRRNSISV